MQFGLPPKRELPAIPDDPPTGVPFLLGAVAFAAVGATWRTGEAMGRQGEYEALHDLHLHRRHK